MTGRASDSAIVGAGTYASNETCAVSCTGHGEFFIRGAIAHEVSALMKYGRLSLSEAAHFAIHRTLAGGGGDGGLIALDSKGNCALPFNSEGMFRGMRTSQGQREVAIYRRGGD